MLTFLIKNELFEKYCVDNDITMSLTNKNYIKNIMLNIIEHKIFEFLRIKNINFVWHDTFNYVLLTFYVFNVTKNDKFVTTHFQREIYLINQLSIKIFIDVDIMIFKQMILNVEKQKLTIKSCDVTIDLNMKVKNVRIDWMIRTFQQIIISFNTQMTISIKIRDKQISNNKNYNFMLFDEFHLKFSNFFFNMWQTHKYDRLNTKYHRSIDYHFKK